MTAEFVNSCTRAVARDGPREMMPAKRMIEIPLPIPFWVMCSPIHIISAVPAVNAMMMTMAAHTPVSFKRPQLFSSI